jgi:predicted ATPase/transcriptional regulator with XRE-family HTH domain
MPVETATFGALLRAHRERAGLTHEVLAERADLSAAAIAALERGRRQRPYPDTVRRLAEALALAPDERAALRAAASARGAGAAGPPRAPSPTNLPAPQPGLIGRERAVAALAALVPAHPGRLVTLTGIGGAGKTRLALAAAEALRDAFADDVWLVELAALDDPALVPAAVAATLAIPEAIGAPPVERLAAALRGRRLLLVLDNCEHLLAACSALAERLLAACPEMAILATSREPLQLARERRWPVPALPAPSLGDALAPATVAASPAAQLFLARARAVAPDFDLTDENHATIARICARLGGLPLALELAAARVRVLNPRQILERLDDALRLLTGGSQAAPTRQQTLRATLDGSYALLTPPEQAALRRLAVCADGCEIDAAEVVCAAPDLPAEAVLDAVSRLVDRSLVTVGEAAEAARYGLLEPVRQYALALLAGEERATTQARHAAAYLALAERAAPALHGPEQVAWLGRLEQEAANLRAALNWMVETGDLEGALRLAVALAPFWEGRGHLDEGRRWIVQALGASATADLPARLRACALLADGRLAYWQKRLDESAARLEACLGVARALDDHRLTAEALCYLGAVRGHQGALQPGAALLEESLALARAAEDRAGIARALLVLGVTIGLLGEQARGVALLEESLARFRRLGDARWAAIASTKLGDSLRRLGDPARAAWFVRAGLTGHLAIGDRSYMAHGLHNAVAVLAARARPAQAARLLGAIAALRDVLESSPSPVTQRLNAEIEAAARGQLAAADYLAAWTEGHARPLQEVLAQVLDELATLEPAEPAPDEQGAARGSPPPGDHAATRPFVAHAT